MLALMSVSTCVDKVLSHYLLTVSYVCSVKLELVEAFLSLTESESSRVATGGELVSPGAAHFFLTL